MQFLFSKICLLHLFCNQQTYLQSTTVRLEEWRIRRTDTEKWMHHRQLPHGLKQSVRKYDQYRWVATRGVDEESILDGLPTDLRRDIKRHLCLDLVRQVRMIIVILSIKEHRLQKLINSSLSNQQLIVINVETGTTL